MYAHIGEEGRTTPALKLAARNLPPAVSRSLALCRLFTITDRRRPRGLPYRLILPRMVAAGSCEGLGAAALAAMGQIALRYSCSAPYRILWMLYFAVHSKRGL
ncbi:hypothetical protein Vafri_17148 [Volvox africanus]|uniref:Uncharacterized protein n=1 Tax=Volvox africanus TaxID=51714 RepID=A0A8J4BK30_9CHLO|nr:hypothetical protein Vafri_17148 [Volvox africanus]